MQNRIGYGIDAHRLEAGVHFVVGGGSIPFPKGSKGHSDGDVLFHAIVDAILGSLALADIGQHFPDSDAAYKGADSAELLSHCYALIKQKGYVLGNADITIAAQSPKLAPHIPVMRQRLASVLNVALADISVKATTTEKLGFVGREEGIAVDAVVLLERDTNAA